MYFEVTTGSNSSTPSFFRSSSTDGSGLGVILSIMDHGKDTFAGFSIYSTKEAAVRPVSDHFAANVWTASNNFFAVVGTVIHAYHGNRFSHRTGILCREDLLPYRCSSAASRAILHIICNRGGEVRLCHLQGYSLFSDGEAGYL